MQGDLRRVRVGHAGTRRMGILAPDIRGLGRKSTRYRGDASSVSRRARELSRARALAAVAVLFGAAVVSGCSGSHPGSSSAPTTAASSRLPGDAPSASTGSPTTVPAVNPCSLVSRQQAESALKQALNVKEAPLGPTCIYTDKAATVVATVAVQKGSVEQVRSQMKQVEVTASGKHQLVCGVYGKTMLVTSLSSGSMLEIAAPCPAAQKMAADALAKLE